MTDSLPMPISAPLTPAQRTRVLNLVRRAARAEIMPRFRALSADDIAQKTGPQDLVTEADRRAEAMIARGLVQMFPNALIVGEEDASQNADIIAKIAEAEMAFTIDPVDGTWNYAHGLATFGVIVSALRFGVPVFGVLYDPVMDDAVVADEVGPAQMLQPRRAPRTLSASAGGEVAARARDRSRELAPPLRSRATCGATRHQLRSSRSSARNPSRSIADRTGRRSAAGSQRCT